MTKRPSAFTLVELLVATTLALLLLVAVVTIFGNVAQSITESRSMLEMAEQLRLTAARLQQDLAGVTVTMNPPRKPENNEGYFEYIEGPATATANPAVNTDLSGNPVDTTVGDFDDILMFTTRSTGRPFVGKNGGGTIQSDVAEVAWFVRGRTLHRRVLLVAPSAFTSMSQSGFYANYDVSAHLINGTTNVVPNTLADLTRRECRFAHIGNFPYDVRKMWNWSAGGLTFPTLPTLNECSVGTLTTLLPATTTYQLPNSLDFWTNASGHRVADNALNVGVDGTRVADDVILNNVIGFDVKVWDPDYVDPVTGAKGGYVDLGYTSGAPNDRFSDTYATPGINGRWRVDQRTSTNDLTNPTYDTWSTHYEAVGTVTGDPNAGRATNGLDDDPGSGIVDSDAEKLTSPPYPYPLRGVQVKIRAFEPDSRQVREVTVVQDFLPQ